MPLPGRLVLLGHPVRHSLSPAFQNAALRRAGVPLVYEPLDVPPAALAGTLATLRAQRGAGNVTIPHKAAVAHACARLTDTAARVGAVNTFWTESGALVGDNTDVGGFDAAVRALLGEAPADMRVAVLGAGGGAAAVLAAVERWPGSMATIWGRTPARAAALAERFERTVCAVGEAQDAVRGADLVVNATPIGLDGDEDPVTLEALAPGASVLDLAYRRGGTPWVRRARALGLRAQDGLPMLIEQGALAFERWLGVAPDRAAMWGAVT